jgi:hypothetical protein
MRSAHYRAKEFLPIFCEVDIFNRSLLVVRNEIPERCRVDVQLAQLEQRRFHLQVPSKLLDAPSRHLVSLFEEFLAPSLERSPEHLIPRAPRKTHPLYRRSRL